MIRFKATACLAALVISCLADAALAQSSSADDKAWTLVLYVCGDNSLSEEALIDLNEVEGAMGSVDANVLLLLDQAGNSDTRAYEAKHDPLGAQNEAIFSQEVPLGDVYGDWEGLSELDLSNPNTLLRFSQWAVTNYPADRFGLVLWDHGDGWRRLGPAQGSTKSICTDGDGEMSMPDVEWALETLETRTGTQFNLIGMDACLMGMVEVAYQLKELCEILVASEESVPKAGWDYGFIKEITSSSPPDAKDLASHIVRYYQDAYTDGYPYPNDTSYFVLTAIDVTDFGDEFIPTLDSLARLLMASMRQNKTKLSDAYYLSYRMDGYRFYVDFRDFMYSIAYQGISEAITEAAYAAVSAHDALIYYHRQGDSFPYCNGLSIYFEPLGSNYDDNYDGPTGFLRFTADSLWDELLNSFYDPGGVLPQIDFTPLPDTEQENEQVKVSCTITSTLPLLEDGAILYFKTDGDFENLSFQEGSGQNEYVASIPGQPYDTQVSYYLRAENIAGSYATSPVDAPSHVHSFWVRPDTFAPSITHTPLQNQAEGREYFEIDCQISDNLGVDNDTVKVTYRINDGDEAAVKLNSVGDSAYTGQIHASGLFPGDRVLYHLDASDLAREPNSTRLPEQGDFSFSIIPSLGSVLLIDDSSGGSAELFDEALGSLGYDVDFHIPGQPLPDGPFDFVVYCLGDASDPIPAYHEALVDYVLSGGRLLIESGDLAYSACVENPTLLSSLREHVLHISEWKADYGQTLVLKASDAFVATVPNVLDPSISYLDDTLRTTDVCIPAGGTTVLYNWSQYSYPGLLLFDDNEDPSDGGQIIYMTFAIPYLSDYSEQRTPLIENCAYWLSTYVRDSSSPVVSDASPPLGATVSPDASLEFVLLDSETGVDPTTVSLSLNGEPVTPEICRLDGHYSVSISYHPEGGLMPGQRYDVELAACDFAGNCLSLDDYWFRTASEDAAPPVVLAAGFMEGQIGGPGDAVRIIAMVEAYGEDNDVDRVELLYEGAPLGITLNDDGVDGDSSPGDGVYSGLLTIPDYVTAGQYVLQIVAWDGFGQQSAPWPQLRVDP